MVLSLLLVAVEFDSIHSNANIAACVKNLVGSSVEYFDVVVSNSSIVGYVILENASRVRIEQCGFYGSVLVVLKDSTYLEVTNSRIESMTIILVGHSGILMRNISIASGITIMGFEMSFIRLQNIINGSLQIILYNHSETYLEGLVPTNTFVSAYDYSTIYIRNLSTPSPLPSIKLEAFNSSRLHIDSTSSRCLEELSLHGSSFSDIENSSVDVIFTYDESSLVMTNTSVYNLTAYGGNVNVNSARLVYLRNMYPGASGEIRDSIISDVGLLSREIIVFENTDIGFIRYVRVFNSSLVINSTGWYSDSYYANFRCVGCTINSSVDITDRNIIVVDSSYLLIQTIISVDLIIVENVPDFSIGGTNVSIRDYIYARNSLFAVEESYVNASGIGETYSIVLYD